MNGNLYGRYALLAGIVCCVFLMGAGSFAGLKNVKGISADINEPTSKDMPRTPVPSVSGSVSIYVYSIAYRDDADLGTQNDLYFKVAAGTSTNIIYTSSTIVDNDNPIFNAIATYSPSSASVPIWIVFWEEDGGSQGGGDDDAMDISPAVGGGADDAPTANAGAVLTITYNCDSDTFSGHMSGSAGTWYNADGEGSPDGSTGTDQNDAALLFKITDNFAYTITFYMGPSSGGSITFDGNTYSNGGSTNKPAGTYSVSANPASGYSFSSWSRTGGVSTPSGGTTTISGDGSLTANFVDNEPPTVSITYPSDGNTVSGTVVVTASASDNVGVAKVEFYLDNVIQKSDSTSPYTWSWDTTTATDGSHTLKVIAYDAENNQQTDQITVNVDNGPPVLEFSSVIIVLSLLVIAFFVMRFRILKKI